MKKIIGILGIALLVWNSHAQIQSTAITTDSIARDSIIADTSKLKPVEDQNLWSLEECIDYAMENSLEVQQQLINVYQEEISLKQNKWNRSGDLSGSVSGSYNFGRFLNSQNAYVDENSWGGSGSLSYGVNVFNGFRINNLVKMQEKLVTATEQDLESIQEAIALEVTFAYLDAIYAKELVKVAEAQLKVSQDELRITEVKYNAGEAAKDVLLESQAQLAREESTLASAEADVSLNLLKLSQMLNMNSMVGFDIIVPYTEDVKAKLSIMSARDIFNETVNNRPNLMAAEFRIQGAESYLKASKANYYPSLAFGASLSTSYNNKNYYSQTEEEYLAGAPLESIPFNEQLTNFRQGYLGLQLSIPIFSSLSVRNNVKRQQLNIESSRLDLDIAKRDYRETIQKAYSEAIINHKLFVAAQKVAEASRSSFEFAQQKYNAGAMSIFDFNTSKNNMTKADVELLQAKYKFIFATKVLDYYRGIPLSLPSSSGFTAEN